MPGHQVGPGGHEAVSLAGDGVGFMKDGPAAGEEGGGHYRPGGVSTKSNDHANLEPTQEEDRFAGVESEFGDCADFSNQSPSHRGRG